MVEDKCQDFCQDCNAKKIDYSLPKYVDIGSIFATISDLLYAFSAQVDLTVLTNAQCTSKHLLNHRKHNLEEDCFASDDDIVITS